MAPGSHSSDVNVQVSYEDVKAIVHRRAFPLLLETFLYGESGGSKLVHLLTLNQLCT